jgi:Tol biopolymer transport system component
MRARAFCVRRLPAAVIVAFGCGRAMLEGPDEGNVVTVEHSDGGNASEAAAPGESGVGDTPSLVDAGSIVDAAADDGLDVAAPLALDDPCAVYRADEEVDNVYELFLSCTSPDGGGAVVTKINRALIDGGDVSSLFGASIADGGAFGNVAYLATGDSLVHQELYLAHLTAGSIGAATKVNPTLTGTDQIFSFRFSEDGRRLAYLRTSSATGRLFLVDVSGAAPGTPAAIDEANGSPVLGSGLGVQSYFFVGRTLFFAGYSEAGPREWYAETLDGSGSGLPVRITPAGANVGATQPVAPNDAWIMYAQYSAGASSLDAFLVDLRLPGAPSTPVKLTPSMVLGGQVTVFDARFSSRDDGVFAFTADAVEDEKRELYYVRLSGGIAASTYKANGDLIANGDVLSYAIAPDGQHLAYRANAVTPTLVELYDADISGGTPDAGRISESGAAKGVEHFVFGTNTKVVYRTDSDVQGTSAIYVVDVASGGAPKLVTASGVGTAVGTLLAVPSRSRVYVTVRTGNAIDLDEIDLSKANPDLVQVNGAFADAGFARTVDTAKDGGAIFYRANGGPNATDLYRVDVSGAAPKPAVQLTGSMPAGGSVLGYVPFTPPR